MGGAALVIGLDRGRNALFTETLAHPRSWVSTKTKNVNGTADILITQIGVTGQQISLRKMKLARQIGLNPARCAPTRNNSAGSKRSRRLIYVLTPAIFRVASRMTLAAGEPFTCTIESRCLLDGDLPRCDVVNGGVAIFVPEDQPRTLRNFTPDGWRFRFSVWPPRAAWRWPPHSPERQERSPAPLGMPARAASQPVRQFRHLRRPRAYADYGPG